MKVKIRGLVFAGFTAAVFAQSAMALQPAANLTNGDIDVLKSTVTSKYYVDTNYQDLVQKESTSSTGETTINEESDDAHYPTSKNVYEFVKDQVATLDSVANIQGDGEYTNVETVNTGTEANPVLVKQVELQQAPVTTNGGITGTLTEATSKKLVTAGAVKSLMDTSITSDDANNDAQMPTSKAVYDFMNNENNGFQRKITEAEASALANFNTGSDAGKGVMIGYRGTNGEDSGWNVFGARADAVYDGDDASNTHLSYLEIQRDNTINSRGAYWINIKRGALAEDAQAIGAANSPNSTAFGTRDRLTTAYAVYQYAVPYQWDASTQANKTLVTNAQGVVTVSEVPAIPEIITGDPCKTAGVHCALVSSADNEGNVTFSWNVMAGAGAN